MWSDGKTKRCGTLILVKDMGGGYSVFEYDTVTEQLVIESGHQMALSVGWFEMNDDCELILVDSYGGELDWEDSYEAFDERNHLKRLEYYSWNDMFGLDSFYIDADTVFGD